MEDKVSKLSAIYAENEKKLNSVKIKLNEHKVLFEKLNEQLKLQNAKEHSITSNTSPDAQQRESNNLSDKNINDSMLLLLSQDPFSQASVSSLAIMNVEPPPSLINMMPIPPPIDITPPPLLLDMVPPPLFAPPLLGASMDTSNNKRSIFSKLKPVKNLKKINWQNIKVHKSTNTLWDDIEAFTNEQIDRENTHFCVFPLLESFFHRETTNASTLKNSKIESSYDTNLSSSRSNLIQSNERIAESANEHSIALNSKLSLTIESVFPSSSPSKINERTIMESLSNSKLDEISCSNPNLASNSSSTMDLREINQETHKATIKSIKFDQNDLLTSSKIPNLVIDPKTAQNLNIAIKSTKVDLQILINKITDLNFPINSSIISLFQKTLADTQMINELLKHTDNTKSLSLIEYFLCKLASINNIDDILWIRLKLCEFPQCFEETNNMLDSLIKSCRVLIESKNFKKILALVLLVGNYMNAGSFNQQTIGFDIRFLSKLSATKANGMANNYTLVHFMIEKLIDMGVDCSEIPKEFTVINESQKFNIDLIKSNIRDFEIVQKKFSKVVESSAANLEDEHVTKTFDEFLRKWSEKLEITKENLNILNEQNKLLFEWFLIDTDISLESLLCEINSFMQDFQKSCLDVSKEKNKKLEKAKRETYLKNFPSSKKSPNTSNIPKLTKPTRDDKLIDELLNILEKGGPTKSVRK